MRIEDIGRKAARPVLCALFLVTGTAQSAVLSNGLSGGLTFSDNIRRASTNETDEAIVTVDATVNVSRVSRATDLLLVGFLGVRHYVDDTYDNNMVGNLLASARYNFVPEAVSWVIENRFGTLQQNPYAASTPDNLENINNFGTGPDFRLRLGDVMALELSGRYRNNWFEESNADNENIGGELRLVRALSSKRNVSLSYRADSIDYKDETVGSDFDRTIATVGFDSEMARGSVSVNVGVNEIDVDGEKSDGFYGNLRLTRDLTSRSRLSVLYDQRYSEAGDIFRVFQDPGRQPGGDIFDIPGVGEPFEARRFQVGLTHARERGGWYASAYTFDEDYVTDSALDRTRLGVSLGLNRNLGSLWSGRLSVRYENLDPAEDQADFDDLYFQAGLSRRLSRSLYLNFDYQLATRDSSAPSGDYTENRIGVTLRYARSRE